MFQVGDKVRVRQDTVAFKYKGQIGTIAGVGYRVKLPYDTVLFLPDELELVEKLKAPPSTILIQMSETDWVEMDNPAAECEVICE